MTAVGANFRGAAVGPSVLREADLSGANLSGTVITGGKALLGTNLSGANLSGASINGLAVLASTNLTDTNLNHATVTGQAAFYLAVYKNTTCPDGTNSDNDGGTCVGHGIS